MITHDYSNMPLFSSTASQDARDVGMDKAAGRDPELLELAREIAAEIAAKRGSVTMDDVSEVLWAKHRRLPSELGNAAGSVFKKGFRCVGYENARRVQSHARLIRRWALK